MRTTTALFSFVLLCTACFHALSSDSSLTVISFGGATKVAQQNAYFQPFEQGGAGRVVAGEYNGELSKIKAMIDVGDVSWDVVEVESPELIRGCEEGLFERLDPNILGDQSTYLPGTVSECGVASYVWSMVLAYNPESSRTVLVLGQIFGIPSLSRESGAAQGS